jgi:hypothetical protein
MLLEASPASARRRWRRAPLALLIVVVALASWAQVGRRATSPSLFRSSDTQRIIDGAEVASSCIGHGVLRSCGRPAPPLRLGGASIPATRVERYALLLYVPALAARAVGVGAPAAVWLIAFLNAAAFVLLVCLPWLARGRLPKLYDHRHLWAVVCLCGPLLPYAASTWSEVLAAALFALAVFSAAGDGPWWATAALAFGAGISKETAAPFVLLLTVAVIDVRRLKALWPTVVGMIGALAANAMFNVFRFGTVRNLTYLDPATQVTKPANVARQLAAVLFSRNGGLIEFWPALLVVAFLVVASVGRLNRTEWVRVALVALAFGGYCVTAATRYAPFGWVAWGPRLVLPVVPATVLALLLVTPARGQLGPALAGLAAVASIMAVANVAVLTAQDKVVEFVAAPRPCRLAATTATGDAYVHCTMRRAWGPPTLITSVTSGLRDGRTAGLAVLDVGAGLVLSLAMYQQALTGSGRRRPRTRPRSTAG